MEDWLNKLKYGNISNELLELLKRKSITDEVIPILDEKYGSKLDFPKSDSDETKDELNTLVKSLKLTKEEANKKHLKRYKNYDKNLAKSIISVFQTKNLDVEDLTLKVFDDVSPTIAKLKQKYQRPRPYQLATYYKLKLFPYSSYTAHSPSYPSGHTLQAFLVLEIIGNKFPDAYEFCQKFIDDVANSRVYLGLHYPSDNEASFVIGQELLKLKSITSKYEI